MAEVAPTIEGAATVRRIYSIPIKNIEVPARAPIFLSELIPLADNHKKNRKIASTILCKIKGLKFLIISPFWKNTQLIATNAP